MSESKIFFRLTQATNTYKHISRNQSFFKVFSHKVLSKKLALLSKNIIALNLYIVINELVYERRLMMKVFPMTKCVKTFFAKHPIICQNIWGGKPSPHCVQAHI